LLFSLSSCAHFKYLYLSEENEQVYLYNKYKLKFHRSSQGKSDDTHYALPIGVSFINKTYADSMDINTLPVLIFDSACVIGDCIGKEFCRVFVYDTYFVEDSIRSQLSQQVQDSLAVEDIIRDEVYTRSTGYVKYPDKDICLPYGTSRLEPLNFYLPNGFELPIECLNSSVTVTIYSRLLDRITKKTIDSAMTPVILDVKKKLKWYRG